MPGVIRIDYAGVVALLTDGFTMAETARRMGTGETHVQWIARKHRDDYPGVRRRAPINPFTGRPVERIRVPDEFRDAGLAEDYRDLCRDFGTAEGERRCRRLLAETEPRARTLAAEARLGDLSDGGRG